MREKKEELLNEVLLLIKAFKRCTSSRLNGFLRYNFYNFWLLNEGV